VQRGQAVLVDTNIIIEAIRIGYWSALTGHFQVETVEKCREEARTGRTYRPGYVTVDERALRERLIAHDVDSQALARLTVRAPSTAFLDPGERHLWAHALGRTDAWLASTADAAAIGAAVGLQWEDRLVSLEQLLDACGARSSATKLNKQFRTEQLSGWRTAALLARGLK
jgi:hypothetical protein